MDIRCFYTATSHAIRRAFTAFIILVIVNVFVKSSYPISLLMCFALLYGIGTHLGFCLGFNYKIIPFSLPIIVGVAINFSFLILPLISKQEGSYGLNLAFFFNFAYISYMPKGKDFYDLLEKEDNEKNESSDDDQTKNT